MHRFDEYVEGISSGRIVANRYIKAVVSRHVADMAKSKEADYPFTFDRDKAQRFVSFVELCKHYKGEWAGRNLVLEPWQVFVFGMTFGWVKKANRRRRYSKVFVFVARKNGKSTMVSPGLIYDCLTTAGGEAYCVATKKDQAKIIFESVRQMVRQNPIFSKRLTTYTSMNSIINKASAAKIQALSSDANTLDGLNPSFTAVDEVAAMKDMRLINVIESGTGSQPEPLIFEITSGSDNVNSAGAEEFNRGAKILEGYFEDDFFLPILYTLDKDDSWQDSATYIKANPNLGISISMEYLLKMRNQAIQQPQKEAEFRTKNLCQFISPMTSWITAQAWNKCKDNANKYRFNLEDCDCIAAVDMSHRLDFTSYTIYFYDRVQEVFFAKHHFYIPEGQIEAKCRTDSELVRDWIRKGLITATEGDTINFSVMFADMESDLNEYRYSELLFDPWDSGELRNRMSSQVDLVEIAQTLKMLSPMAKDWEAAILEGKIVDDNPVMGWMVSNCDVYKDPNDNIKPVKHGGKNSPYHIDGVVTSLMAMGRIQQKLLDGSLDHRTAEEIERDMEAELAMLDY